MSQMNYQTAVFLSSLVTLVLLDRFCDVLHPTVFTGIFLALIMVVASAFFKYQRMMQQRYKMRKESSSQFSRVSRTSQSTVNSDSSFHRGVSEFEGTPRSGLQSMHSCPELRGCTWQEALSIVRSMDEPTAHVYNSLLNSLTKANKTRLAVDLLEEMMAAGVQPTSVGFHAALHICANTKEWQLGLNLFRKGEALGLSASPVTYGIAINVMTKSNQSERAFDLLEEMKQTVGPNGVALSASMMACIPSKDWQRALGYFDDLKKFGIEANIVSYGSIIDVLGKAGQWGRAMEFFNEMHRLNIRPNEVIYGSMVNFMAKAGQWRVALETFNQMDRDVGANEIALNSAIRACSADNQWPKAISLLKDYVTNKHNVAIKAYVATLDVLAQCNQYAASQELFEEVLEKGYQPDMKTFNAVLSSFRALQWQMAVDFFGRHQSLGIYPDPLSYQVLIKSLVIAKQRDLAWQYFTQMIENGVSPTSHLCDVMARLCPHAQFRKMLGELESSPKSQQKFLLPRLESFVLSY